MTSTAYINLLAKKNPRFEFVIHYLYRNLGSWNSLQNVFSKLSVNCPLDLIASWFKNFFRFFLLGRNKNLLSFFQILFYMLKFVVHGHYSVFPWRNSCIKFFDIRDWRRHTLFIVMFFSYNTEQKNTIFMSH